MTLANLPGATAHGCRALVAFAACLAAPTQQATLADTVTSTWIGPPGGSWHVPSHWSPPGIPNAGDNRFTVFIPPKGSPQLVSGPIFLESITLGTGASLELLNDLNVGGGVIHNDGTIYKGRVYLGAKACTIEGSGVIGGEAPEDACQIQTIEHQLFGPRLTNAAGHTLRGTDLSNLTLDNRGTIESGPSTVALVTSGTANDNFNQGVLRATEGGSLALRDITNWDGEIVALDGSSVTTLSVIGGTVRTEGTGTVICGGGLLQDVHLIGAVALGTSSLAGTIDVDGASVLSNASLKLHPPSVAIQGGEFLAGSFGSQGFWSSLFTTRLELAEGVVLRGRWNFDDSINLVNDGEIVGAPQLRCGGGPSANVNRGLIRADSTASSNAQAAIIACSLDNAAGTISAMGVGFLRLEASTAIFGGTLTQLDAATVQLGGLLAGVTFSGEAIMTKNTSLYLLGAFHNNGSVVAKALDSPYPTPIRIASSVVVLDGGGALIGPPSPVCAFLSAGDPALLVNGSRHTMEGSFTIGTYSTTVRSLDFLNEGLLNLTAGALVSIDATSATVNLGEIRIASDARLALEHGVLDNSGLVRIAQGGQVVAAATIEFAPKGTLEVTVETGGGTPPISSQGVVQLSGTLRVVVADDPPVPGSRVPLVTGQRISGQFEAVDSTVPVRLIYEDSTVELEFGTNVIADFNGDGSVNGADLGVLLASWGPCTDCAQDLDSSGAVDDMDLLMLLELWS